MFELIGLRTVQGLNSRSLISFVAFSAPTMAGKPYSGAITTPCVIKPPTSVIFSFMDTNNDVYLGFVNVSTIITFSSILII
jgi:hypothetical protein